VLAGHGSSDDSFDNNNFGVSAQAGWYLSEGLELGIRQSVNGAVIDDGDDSWNGSSRFYADYHFGDAMAVPFIGANIGGIYGEGVNDSGSAGLDAGLKFYVKDDTFIMLLAEYQFLFSDADEIDDQFDDGAFFYTLGVGFNF
jgi:hypothetical protein